MTTVLIAALVLISASPAEGPTAGSARSSSSGAESGEATGPQSLAHDQETMTSDPATKAMTLAGATAALGGVVALGGAAWGAASLVVPSLLVLAPMVGIAVVLLPVVQAGTSLWLLFLNGDIEAIWYVSLWQFIPSGIATVLGIVGGGMAGLALWGPLAKAGFPYAEPGLSEDMPPLSLVSLVATGAAMGGATASGVVGGLLGGSAYRAGLRESE